MISDDFHAFSMTSRAMAVLYIIGVGAVGSVLLVNAVSIAIPRAQYGVFEFGLLVVSSCIPFYPRESRDPTVCWLLSVVLSLFFFLLLFVTLVKRSDHYHEGLHPSGSPNLANSIYSSAH